MPTLGSSLKVGLHKSSFCPSLPTSLSCSVCRCGSVFGGRRSRLAIQCVRIEQNRDNSVTYHFSDTDAESLASALLSSSQLRLSLEAQLSAIASARDAETQVRAAGIEPAASHSDDSARNGASSSGQESSVTHEETALVLGLGAAAHSGTAAEAPHAINGDENGRATAAVKLLPAREAEASPSHSAHNASESPNKHSGILDRDVTHDAASANGKHVHHNGHAAANGTVPTANSRKNGKSGKGFQLAPKAAGNGVGKRPFRQGPAQHSHSAAKEPSVQLDSAQREVLDKLERSWSGASQEHILDTSTSGRSDTKAPALPARKSTADEILARMNAATDDAMTLLGSFSDLCAAGHLDAALSALSMIVKADRRDVLVRLRQRHFLKRAAQLATPKAVRQALRFVQVLPRANADLRTYNMLVTVCIRARDVPSALRAADMLRSTGRKPDVALYTNLITACAAVGDADMAFRLHSEMVGEGPPPDRKASTSLISACSREISNTPPSQRRQQLVLLERAAGVMTDMMGRGGRASVDQSTWNCFITAAGRANQLQRAFQALEDMQQHGERPGAATYGSILEACVRSGRKDLALKVYRRALNDDVVDSLPIYTLAIAACRADKDLATATDIYSQLQRNGVQPDDQLYGVLISVVGDCGDMPLALGLLSDMQESDILPEQGTYSSLVDTCLVNDDLPAASRLYREAQAAGVMLHAHVLNALLNAWACAGNLREVAAVVRETMQRGFRPDKFTFTAVLTACQRTLAADLAFDVLRVMHAQRIGIDETICTVLLRTCFNKIRSLREDDIWEEEVASRVSKEEEAELRSELVQALMQGEPLPKATRSEENLAWGKRAVNVYHELLNSGVKPGLHVLNRLLGCLRLQRLPQPKFPPTDTGFGPPKELRHYLLPDGRKCIADQFSVKGIYESRALSLVEEAIGQGILPCFQTTKGGLTDLRGMPPAVAEVYVLAMLASLVDSPEHREHLPHISFKVPPYLEALLKPEHEAASTRAERLRESKPADEVPRQEERTLWESTGLKVAHLLDYINIWTHSKPSIGDIWISAEEVTRWVGLAKSAAAATQMESMSSLQKERRIGDSIIDQQMNIRMGMADRDQHEDFDGMPKPGRRQSRRSQKHW